MEYSDYKDIYLSFLIYTSSNFFESRNIKFFIENELLNAYAIFEQSKLRVKSEEEEFQFALMTSRNNVFRHILG